MNVFACSNEDILLFKAIARREEDIEDCIALARQSLDWSIIIKEINYQIKKGKEIWITYIEVPIMKEVMNSYEDYMDKLV